jgi:phage terminase large subunit-like protein
VSLSFTYDQYVADVLNGRVAACKLARQACERHVKDLVDGAERGLRFDPDAAEKVIAFCSLLKHTKAEWNEMPFLLEPWQQFIIACLFGWKRSNGYRRFRTAYLELPRKNGKSTLGSALALYMLFADGEASAEIYSAAADKTQAGIIFLPAKAMLEASPALLEEKPNIYQHTISVPSTHSFYRIVSADAKHQQGFNSHLILFDELHEQPTRDLWDVLASSMGARRQALMVAMTTAGYDRNSICWEQHEYARQILEAITEDDSFFAIIYGAAEDDNMLDEGIWEQVNPNLGISVKREFLREEAQKAKSVPAYQNTFRRYYLNQWTSQQARWLDMEAWNVCGEPFDEGLLTNGDCYGGLDLASESDLAAFVLDFPEEVEGEDQRHRWLAKFWIPGENIEQRMREHRVEYDVWIRDGLIQITEGNIIDYEVILRDIEALGLKYNIKEIAFDRWGATQVSTRLAQMGFSVVGFGQGMASMAAPTKELLRIVLGKRLEHGGNPVLKWNADNMVVDTDAAGNVKPNKKMSRQKIDGVVAGIMALSRAMLHEDEGGSAYEERGLVHG